MSDALPNSWAQLALGEVATSEKGKLPKKFSEEVKDGFLPYIDIKAFEEGQIRRYATTRGTTITNSNDVFVVWDGARFGLAGKGQKGVLGSTLARVGSLALLPDFLYYFIHSKYRMIQSKPRGTGTPHVEPQLFWALKAPIAPAKEQQRIVSKIDELFSRIEEGEQALARVKVLVERYRQAVLKAAVTGELTREWREARAKSSVPQSVPPERRPSGRSRRAADGVRDASTPLADATYAQRERDLSAQPDTSGIEESGAALLARILKARRAAWEKSELEKMRAKGITPANDHWKKKYKEPAPPDTTDLPELPDGWVWASPEQLTGHHPHALTIGPFGSDLKVSDYKDSGVPLVFVRNIRSGVFRGDDAKYVSEQKARALSAHLVRGGDLLITKMGDPPGDVCVYPPSEPDAVITADCIKWTLNPVLRSPAFIRTVVASQVGQMQIQRITTGVAQQKVSLARFRKLAICLPGRQEQGEIDDRVDVMLGRVVEMAREMAGTSSHAAALRQSILKAAFSGQLVPQDANDEPASKLLERIAAERAALIPGPSPKGQGERNGGRSRARRGIRKP